MNSISGATEIRFGNVKKFETVSTGVKITGDIEVTGGFKDSSGGLGTSGQVFQVREQEQVGLQQERGEHLRVAILKYNLMTQVRLALMLI